MSDATHDKWGCGRLTRADSITTTPFEVDFETEGIDRPAEPWSTGRLERVCESLPLASEEFVPATYLEITLQLAADAAPERVLLFALRMISAVHAAAPDLQWVYDLEHSRAEDGKVMIVLTPEDSCKAEEKMESIATMIRKIAEEFPEAGLNGIREYKEVA